MVTNRDAAGSTLRGICDPHVSSEFQPGLWEWAGQTDLGKAIHPGCDIYAVIHIHQSIQYT